MPLIDIPEFDDLEGYEQAHAAIEAVHAAVLESQLLWSILAISDALERHPAVGSITMDVRTPFKSKIENAYIHTWLLLGSRVEDGDGRPHQPLSGTTPEQRASRWTPAELVQALCEGLGRADLWPRIEAGLIKRAARHAPGKSSPRI